LGIASDLRKCFLLGTECTEHLLRYLTGFLASSAADTGLRNVSMAVRAGAIATEFTDGMDRSGKYPLVIRSAIDSDGTVTMNPDIVVAHKHTAV
jgi:hypothetical protein